MTTYVCSSSTCTSLLPTLYLVSCSYYYVLLSLMEMFNLLTHSYRHLSLMTLQVMGNTNFVAQTLDEYK